MTESKTHRVYIYCDKTQEFNEMQAHILGSYAALGRNNVWTHIKGIEQYLYNQGLNKKLYDREIDRNVSDSDLISEIE